MHTAESRDKKRGPQQVATYIIGGVFAVGIILTLLSALHWYIVYTKDVVYLGGTLGDVSSSSIVLINAHGYTREVMYTPSTRFVNRKELVTLGSLQGKSLSVRAHYTSEGVLEAEVLRVIGKQKQ